MILRRTFLRHHPRILKLENPPLFQYEIFPPLICSNSNHLSFVSSILRRPFSILAQFQHTNSGNSEEQSQKVEERLSVFFKQAVGLSEKVRNSESENESDVENADVNKRLKKLEKEVRDLNEKKPSRIVMIETPALDGVSGNRVKPRLYELFVQKNEKPDELYSYGLEDPRVYKKLSPNMELLVYHFYKGGYFEGSNFLKKGKFDLTCFENSYAREFIKFAAVRFGKDNQEIAKWLSGSDLKIVALFGCPSLGKRIVFAAKRLRAFFNIPENTVCQKCPLKMSCKFVNKSFLKGDAQNLQMADVMKLLIMYAMESVPPELTVPDEISDSVSRLLNEILRLSCTVS